MQKILSAAIYIIIVTLVDLFLPGSHCSEIEAGMQKVPPCRYGRACGQKASQSSTREIIKRTWHGMHAGAQATLPSTDLAAPSNIKNGLLFKKHNSSLVLEEGTDKILQILFWLGEIKIPSLENSDLLLGDLTGMLDLTSITNAGHKDNLKSCQKEAISIFAQSFAMSGGQRARERKRKQVVGPGDRLHSLLQCQTSWKGSQRFIPFC